MVSQDPIETQFDSRGLYLGPFRGVRSFRIDPQGFLTGVVFRTRWNVGVNKAICNRSEYNLPYYGYGGNTAWEPHKLPEDHGMDVCRHGFYAYGENSNDYHQPGFVSGVIDGWGKEVMVGTRGFRCMRASIVALCVSEVAIRDRARTELVPGNYPGVPFFDTFAEMVAAFPPDMPEV
jgi:hypothetical protein